MTMDQSAATARHPIRAEAAKACLASFGLAPATEADIGQVRRMGAARIADSIASEATFAAVQAHTGGGALFVRRAVGAAGIDGVLAVLMLTAAGRSAVESGAFDGRQPDLDHVCRPGQTPAAGYGWGFVADSREAARAVVPAAWRLIDAVFDQVPWFTRAATPDGERVIVGRYGYAPLPGAAPGLLWRPAIKAAA